MKLFYTTAISALIALMLTANTATAEDAAGMTVIDIPAPHHGRTIHASVMFPAEGGTQISLGENPVFYGVPVYENAKPLPGKHPLILLSHGWGGNFTRMGWLSAGLAAHGAIVVSVNHPNSTTGDIQFQSGLDHWTRAQDVSSALDYVLNDPALAEIIDPDRIYVAGYSYGGVDGPFSCRAQRSSRRF